MSSRCFDTSYWGNAQVGQSLDAALPGLSAEGDASLRRAISAPRSVREALQSSSTRCGGGGAFAPRLPAMRRLHLLQPRTPCRPLHDEASSSNPYKAAAWGRSMLRNRPERGIRGYGGRRPDFGSCAQSPLQSWTPAHLPLPPGRRQPVTKRPHSGPMPRRPFAQRPMQPTKGAAAPKRSGIRPGPRRCSRKEGTETKWKRSQLGCATNAVQLTPQKFSFWAASRRLLSAMCFPRKCCWANGCARAILKQL